MGPYCQFCDRRCFVERRLPFQAGTLLMATCSRGMDHDRKVTGFDHTTAVNPVTARRMEAAAELEPAYARLLRERDAARATAVALEQENAELVRLVHRALELLPALGSCSCEDEEEALVFDREPCDYCKVANVLRLADFVSNPTGTDRLMDALAGVDDETVGA